ncbi:hypothetical protein EG327_006128 [Venturia inaequalis]|uniref:DUF1479-domain-containing protein n=2 Tax=Venturia inaequalis TaxID=5025 RepID=A0A8H3V255_VENIN|nr:hypothetical protein EG327_006128 [Venturia inaequalis]
MPGVTKAEWPPWQEFTYTKDLATSLSTDPTYAQTKASIIAQFGESNLRKSWLKTCEALKHITADLETKGNEVIPHIDAGSLCRWADPSYRSTYSSIFSGNPENHNSYNLSLRASANQMLFPGNGQSTVLRCFQGWTALSRTAPREGTIRLFPAVKWQIAYILLRPFFKAPEDEADILDAEKWDFDGETPWFPGTVKETSQYVSVASHPHLRLKDCLVYAPPMEAGDTVWWHADMCHAVDAEHTGTTPAAVTYIAATPTTPINKAYMARQHSLMSKGLPPPDFGSGSDESGLVGYEGFKGDEGMWRALMGV